MRLDKLLEASRQGSRKAVKRLLIAGAVRVNGQIVREGRFNADPGVDEISVAGKRLTLVGHTYLLLNKPQGVVSAVHDQTHQTVIDLVSAHPAAGKLFPVGRLDRDTEGLLLLTDNGKLAYELLRPEKAVVKRYEVTVNGLVTAVDQAAFKAGIVFHGGIQCQGAELLILTANEDASRVYLDITEGKFHQVKKMFLAVGKKVTSLKRLQMGSLKLPPDLALGEYRELNEAEVAKLKHFFNPQPIRVEKLPVLEIKD